MSHKKRKHSQKLFVEPRPDNTPTEVNKKNAENLLYWVDHAHYEMIEKFLATNPYLMLMEVPVKDGKPNTPLKRALYNLDTWTWKPFYELIQKNYPELVPEFLKQCDEQKSHVDLQPLYRAYVDEFVDARGEWWKNKDKHIHLIKFAKTQGKYLPWHMLREMCRESTDWSPDSLFDELSAPKGGKVFWRASASTEAVAIETGIFYERYGTVLGVVRRKDAMAHVIGNPIDLLEVCEDLRGKKMEHNMYEVATLKRLYQVRLADLAAIPSLTHSTTRIAGP